MYCYICCGIFVSKYFSGKGVVFELPLQECQEKGCRFLQCNLALQLLVLYPTFLSTRNMIIMKNVSVLSCFTIFEYNTLKDKWLLVYTVKRLSWVSSRCSIISNSLLRIAVSSSGVPSEQRWVKLTTLIAKTAARGIVFGGNFLSSGISW